MKTVSLPKALLEYLMALSMPQALGSLHMPQDKNPFISINKRNGKTTCLVSASEMENFKNETGVTLTKEDILSCETCSDLEALVEKKADSVSKEVLSRVVLSLTSTLGTIWNNLELVENLEEISDGGMVDPAYVWPYPNMKSKPVAEEKRITVIGRLKNILS